MPVDPDGFFPLAAEARGSILLLVAPKTGLENDLHIISGHVSAVLGHICLPKLEIIYLDILFSIVRYIPDLGAAGKKYYQNA